MEERILYNTVEIRREFLWVDPHQERPMVLSRKSRKEQLKRLDEFFEHNLKDWERFEAKVGNLISWVWPIFERQNSENPSLFIGWNKNPRTKNVLHRIYAGMGIREDFLITDDLKEMEDFINTHFKMKQGKATLKSWSKVLPILREMQP